MMRSLRFFGRTVTSVGRGFLGSVTLGSVVLLAQSVLADEAPRGWQASNIEFVGFSGLGGHSAAFKLSIKQANGRWYLYMGHSFEPGWSILDVTDPKNPKYVKFIPGPQGTITSQITLHENLMLTGLGPDESGASGSNTKAAEAAVLLWDISDPVNPKEISGWKGGPREARIEIPIRAANMRISQPTCRAIGDGYWSSSTSAIPRARKRPAVGGCQGKRKEKRQLEKCLRDFTGRLISAQMGKWPLWAMPLRSSISISATWSIPS